MQAEARNESRAPGAPAALLETLRRRQQNFVGEVVFQHGLADVEDPVAGGRARPLEPGMRVARDCRIRVRSGRLLLRLDDGSDLWLAEGAVLELGGWTANARAIALAAGRLLAFVARETRRPFTTALPTAFITVTGTAFEATTHGDHTEVAVLHGSVTVTNAAGRVNARRNESVRASASAAPSVSPLADVAERLAWIGDATASSTNAAIRPAFRAVARHLDLPETTSMLRSSSLRRGQTLTWLAAIALVTAGAAWYFLAPAPKAPAPAEPASSAPPPAAVASQSASAAGAPAPKPVEKREIRLKFGNEEIAFDPKDEASVEAALAKVPADQQSKVRDIVKRVQKGDALRIGGGTFVAAPGGAGSGNQPPPLPPNIGEILGREASASANMVRELIASGMSPEEARRAVGASLTDSLRKQLRAQGSNAELQVMVEPEEGSDRVRLGVMVTDQSTADLGNTENETRLTPGGSGS